MSEHSHKEDAGTPMPSPEKPEGYTYHWNYGAQLSYERMQDTKTRKEGILVYAVSMIAVFLACLLLLGGVLIWHQTGNTGGVDIAAVSESVSPSTVLIYAATQNGTTYGTGFFIREDGYIATNDHVVRGLENITVRLYTGEELKATYVNGSAADDLAVLKISGYGYPTVRIGDSSSLRVGDTVVAVGNPSGLDGAWSTTHGIISSLDRCLAVTGKGYTAKVTMLQTDAPVNPGNSGGPLCNANGEVIAVITRKLTGYEGIGFAIPINQAIQSLNAMIAGTYRQENSTVARVRPSIGVTVSNIEKGQSITFGTEKYTTPYSGVYVQSVTSGSGADGQVQAGDVIYAVDNVAVADMSVLEELLYGYKIGDTVKLKIYRKGQETEVSVRLGVTNE